MMAVFAKGERLRHIGHLDIMRAMQRALRRSGLPVGYSNGFNPHILLAFASALSVGVIGENEVMEVTLREGIAPEQFLEAMNHALPPDMQLQSAKPMADRAPSLMSMVRAAEYTIEVVAEDSVREQLLAAVPVLLQQEEVMAERKTKSGVKEVNIRPLIHELSVQEGKIHALLTLTESASCKVDMLLTALAKLAQTELPRVLVKRNHLLGENENGQLCALELL